MFKDIGYDRRFLVFPLSVLLILLSCQTVPITERGQLRLIPDQQINAMSLDAYGKFVSEHQAVKGTEEAQMVQRVGLRIQDAVRRYLEQNNLSERISGYEWEFNLFKDDSANAWAMPGGKVAVYTGILPITRDEAGLAVVMSHEIAHVIAAHGNERMSQALLTQLGGVALQTAVSQKPALTQQLFMTAFGVGTQVGVLLPYSRIQERESDHLGLIFMAMAGYNPEAAIGFWQRMAQEKKTASVPGFLSTHPSDEERIQNIREVIPEAMKFYRTAGNS
jgi:predicted Zn-dependent protease